MMVTYHSSAAVRHLQLKVGWVGPNYCTEAGAHLLRERIEKYGATAVMQ